MKEYPGEVLRLALLSGHYRQSINWSNETIQQSKNILDRLFGKKWICEYCADIVYSIKQPYCKPCCHIHSTTTKMIKIKK